MYKDPVEHIGFLCDCIIAESTFNNFDQAIKNVDKAIAFLINY